jgi:hypothetical protein
MDELASALLPGGGRLSRGPSTRRKSSPGKRFVPLRPALYLYVRGGVLRGPRAPNKDNNLAGGFTAPIFIKYIPREDSTRQSR